mgnify:FL=1
MECQNENGKNLQNSGWIMQSKLQSITEAIVNVVVGYGVAVWSQYIILPLFDIHVTIQDNLVIGLIFTVISVIRSYTLRRIFNSLK